MNYEISSVLLNVPIFQLPGESSSGEPFISNWLHCVIMVSLNSHVNSPSPLSWTSETPEMGRTPSFQPLSSNPPPNLSLPRYITLSPHSDITENREQTNVNAHRIIKRRSSAPLQVLFVLETHTHLYTPPKPLRDDLNVPAPVGDQEFRSTSLSSQSPKSSSFELMSFVRGREIGTENKGLTL